MLITNFSAGELSPTLNGRVDLQQYYHGAGHIENFDIIPTGGIRRRVGSKRLHQTDGSNRLIPFIINKNLSFVVEIKDHSIMIWELIGDKFARIAVDQPAEYAADEIHQIQYAQNYDTMILVHRNHRPYTLTWDGSKFSFGPITFDFIPDINMDDDFDYIMQCDWKGTVEDSKPVRVQTSDTDNYHFRYYQDDKTVYKTYPITAEVYCTIAGHLYKYNNGWYAEGEDPAAEDGLFITENNYPGCVAFFNNRLWLGSTYKNPQKIWASMAPDTEKNRYYKFATYQKYITVNNSVKDADLHVFSCNIAKSDVSSNQTVIKNVSKDFTAAGFLKEDIKNYYLTGTYFPKGTKVEEATASTIKVNKKATIEKDMENITNAIQLWISSETVTAEDYEFQVVNNNITTADCSFNFELASSENDAIMFLSPGRYLAAGTESSIWSIDPQTNAVAVGAVMQGRYGSDEIQGLAVASAQIYFAQGCRGIREFYYDSASEAFQTNNIAIMAEQMLEESPVVDFDYCTNPYNKLYVLRDDGTIAILLYDKNNGVMGWSRYTRTSGKITNIAVTRGNAQYDLVYLFIEDGEKSYIELIDNSRQVFLDSWQKVKKTEIPALLENYNSGAILYNATTKKECDAFDIPVEFITSKDDEVYIGYKYTSDIVSLPVLANDPTSKKRIATLLVRLLNSQLPVMVCGEKHETFSGKQAPYSGIIQMTYPGNYDRDVTFEIISDIPEQITILSVNAQLAD